MYMKRWFIVLLLVMIIIGCVYAENAENERFRINGLLPTEMTIEDLYDLDDTIVSSLVNIFMADSEELPSGERIGIYVINPRTKKFHYPWCYSALQIGTDRRFIRCAPSELVDQKYKPCGTCNPHVN